MRIQAGFLSILLILLLVAGCSSPQPTTASQEPPSIPPTTISVKATTEKLTPSQTSMQQSTGCVITGSGCIPIPQSPTSPPMGEKIMQSEPIIGSYIFTESQFADDESYYTQSGLSEYDYKVVPLDHSPDIKWTFREDGTILFSRKESGELLRTGTWSKKESDGSKITYQIKRGNHYYTGVYDTKGFRITQPGDWSMIKES